MGTSQATIVHGDDARINLARRHVLPALPAEYYEARWYAAHTSANQEKRVAEQLAARDIEHFLPSYTSVRRWKDRRVTLQLPLFPGYVFVRTELRNRLPVLQIPGLARLVGFGGMPTPLPQEEVDTLRAGLTSGVHAEPHPFLTVGRRVRVRSGAMAGLEGLLIRRKNGCRFVVSVELIHRAVALEVDESDLELAGPLSSVTGKKVSFGFSGRFSRPGEGHNP
jgi:transcription antitermination factor NusG